MLMALACTGVAWSAALGQRGPIRMTLSASPPPPLTLGRQATLGVQPVMLGTLYRYVATMVATGSSMITAGTSCGASQTIGAGTSATWLPASGAYYLTVHAAQGTTARGSASLSYQVDAPNTGFLSASVTQHNQPGSFELKLQTNRRGDGYRYQWVVRFGPAPGAPPTQPLYRTFDSSMSHWFVNYVLQPGTYNISARVGIYTGDPCRILETSTGGISGQVIQ